MRFALTIFSILVSFAAQAQIPHEGGEFGTIYCIQNRQFSPVQNSSSYMVVMNQMYQGRNNRMYSLTLFQKNLRTGQRAPIFTDNVTVYTEDVMAQFRGFRGASGRRTQVMIYLDELNQSYISVVGPNGQPFDLQLICKPNAQLVQGW